jgi:alpha-L-fucosidase 2
LRDGERANKIFKGYLKEQAYPQLFAKCFTPLQVDGSMGMTAGISELLVQSNEGYIELLPALPSEWKDGSFSGVCTREGFEISFSWKDGVLSKLTILSKQGRPCRLRAGVALKSLTRGLKVSTKEPGIMEFATTQGQRYEFLAK